MKSNNTHIERKLKRQQQVDAGAYDGRFRTKVVESKKKKQHRKHKKIILQQLDIE